MPIRLNLLAEDQAAEELRRRDPVKRAIWVAGLLVAVMLVWSSSLQVKAMLAHSNLSRVEIKIGIRTNEYQQVLDFQKKSGEVESKLAALHQLATNRFLNGTMLNALQQTTIENVQLSRLKAEQSYLFTDEVKAKKTESGRTLLAKPATVTEKIVLTVEAKDTAPHPGEQRIPFTDALARNPYLQNALGKTNEVKLTFLSGTLSQPDGKAFVEFKLECRFPEKTR